MIAHRPGPSWAASGAAVAAGLLAARAPADPGGAAVRLTPPLAAARTFQVTETVSEAADGATPGPLRLAGTLTFRVQRPDRLRVRFRVEWRPAVGPASYTVSDGTTLARSDGRHTVSQPADRAEWPFPLMGLLNNMPGPVSAAPAVLGGRRALLAVRASPVGRDEFWFDPRTHLLLRWASFITWQGKTSETMRTDYSGWALNKPLPPAVFRLPSAGSG